MRTCASIYKYKPHTSRSKFTKTRTTKIPIIEINQSNKTYINVNNITSIYKDNFPSISIKNFIKNSIS